MDELSRKTKREDVIYVVGGRLRTGFGMWARTQNVNFGVPQGLRGPGHQVPHVDDDSVSTFRVSYLKLKSGTALGSSAQPIGFVTSPCERVIFRYVGV